MSEGEFLTTVTGAVTKLQKGHVLRYDSRIRTLSICDHVGDSVYVTSNDQKDNKLFVGYITDGAVMAIAKLIAATHGYGIRKYYEHTQGVFAYEFV